MRTEHPSPRYSAIDLWDPAEALDAMLEGQFAAVAAVYAARPALERAALGIDGRLRGGGRLVYAGAGTSGRLAVQDGAELMPTFSWPPERLVLLMAGGQDALLRAVEGAAWWGQHVALLPRLFPEAVLQQVAPRAMIAASWFSARALRLLRALGPVAPEAVECRLFQDADGPVVSLEHLDLASDPGQPRPAGAGTAAEAPRAAVKEAAVLIERLERLRFSEGFR